MTEREEQAIIVLNTLYNNPLLSDIHRQALEVGIMAIKAQSSSEKPNKWISLDEKEPKDGQLILVTFVNMYDKRYVRIAEFREEVYRKYDGKIDQRYYGFHSVENIYSLGDKAVAWMPLSDPYKQEVEND